MCVCWVVFVPQSQEYLVLPHIAPARFSYLEFNLKVFGVYLVLDNVTSVLRAELNLNLCCVWRSKASAEMFVLVLSHYFPVRQRLVERQVVGLNVLKITEVEHPSVQSLIHYLRSAKKIVDNRSIDLDFISLVLKSSVVLFDIVNQRIVSLEKVYKVRQR